MRNGRAKYVLTVCTLLALCSLATAGQGPKAFSGSIAGIVKDPTGVPQMGATVLLLSRYDRILQRALTNERGAFGFEGLSPDLYSVRVSLASFVPAMRHKIAVQPGMQSLLAVDLASLFSSIELRYVAPGQGALMSDDWKWTLRTATATRPILRLRDSGVKVAKVDGGSNSDSSSAMFRETRGMLRVSAGDSSSLFDSGQSDLGTAFALATSLYGRSQLQVSGNVGMNAVSPIPAASLRTSYSTDDGGPEISMTMRQVYLPVRMGSPVASSQTDSMPALRTLSLATIDRQQLTDNLRVEYGMSMDSVSFLEHLNHFSPFARVSYELGAFGAVRAAFSSGSPPAELFTRSGGPEMNLNQDLQALALSSQISLRNERAAMERTQNFELGYEKKMGSRTIGLTAFRESVSNGALMMAAPEGVSLEGADVLPDVSSRNTSIVNIGNYSRYGYSTTLTQSIGEKLELSASAGRAGSLSLNQGQVQTADDIRSQIHLSQRYWAAVHVSDTLPKTGTQISTSYQWTDYNSILPEHLYLTQTSTPDAGWNIHVRQPIPIRGGLPGRLEATADLRNMLAQGYLSLPAGVGQRVLLMQSPRMVRGGLSFIF
jgi:hypothetical protein